MKKDIPFIISFPGWGSVTWRELAGCMCWPLGINQMSVTPQTSQSALWSSTSFTSLAQIVLGGRVVIGRLKRMIVTVSSSSRLLISAHVCLSLPCLPLSALSVRVCLCLLISTRVCLSLPCLPLSAVSNSVCLCLPCLPVSARVC